ncbi:MAG: LysM peptidoglycan-binding domain-containing protein, partial [Gemmatimonadota bacterium]|nr:LysM peptidoglycan-binding domain-containing protein [Gemmatimonadota bacterium]
DERVTWTFHVVARGQTLSQIARNYGVSVSALRAANGNVNPRRLQIGQRLVVPNPARVASRGSSDSSTRERARTSRGPVTIVVERGDSLWAIARRYSVSTRDLMSWNGLSTTTIRPGDRLEIRR